MLIEIRDSGAGPATAPAEMPSEANVAGDLGNGRQRTPAGWRDPELLALVGRARAHDGLAQSELVRRYQSRIAGYVRPMLSGGEGVEDVVQNVFVKMVRRLGALRNPAGFESWLFTLARNTALDSLRRARCRPVTVAAESDWLAVEDPTLADRSREILEALEVVTREWDETSRRMLTHLLEGTGYDIIARNEGLTVGAIKLRLHRLRLRLRQNLRIALGEEPGRRSLFERDPRPV